MSAELIAGAAMGGLAIASTGLTIQAAGNLMNQVRRVGRMTRSRRSKPMHKHLSVHIAVFGDRHRRTNPVHHHKSKPRRR